MSCCFYKPAPFTAVICNEAALPGIKALVLINNPLVETAFTQRFPLRLLRELRLSELNNLSHGSDLVCKLAAVVSETLAVYSYLDSA